MRDAPRKRELFPLTQCPTPWRAIHERYPLARPTPDRGVVCVYAVPARGWSGGELHDIRSRLDLLGRIRRVLDQTAAARDSRMGNRHRPPVGPSSAHLSGETTTKARCTAYAISP